MPSIKIRYLVVKPGRQGGLPRYYWQPSPEVKVRGFVQKRVPPDWSVVTNATELRAKAIAAAEELNNWLDAKREAEPRKPAGLPLPGPRTVNALIELYRASERFTSRMPSTRKSYEQNLQRISQWAGDAPVVAIDYKRIEKLKAAMRTTPAFRNSVIGMLRILLDHGVRIGWLHTNPAERPQLEKLEPTGLVWPREAVTAFVAAADAQGRHSIGTAVLLNEWLGQRQGDILRLTRAALIDGTIHVRQSKTGSRVSLPIDAVPHLMQRVQEAIAVTDARWAKKRDITHLIIDEHTGRPYNKHSFRHLFSVIRAEAAKAHPTFEAPCLLPGREPNDPDGFKLNLVELKFLHLRHTAVTRLAEAGCDVPTIAAVTGHAAKSVEIVMSRYLVKTRKLARIAFERRLEVERREEEQQQPPTEQEEEQVPMRRRAGARIFPFLVRT